MQNDSEIRLWANTIGIPVKVPGLFLPNAAQAWALPPGCCFLGLMSEGFGSQWGPCLARMLACNEGMNRHRDRHSEKERLIDK